ncbi:pre-mRNA-splicing factor ISY1 [Angomonas deanei]|uniref:Isy1-like splicing family, putative n=1 Tax=Angomonas deanei TaxID=59799 RepID=S9VJT8_9TRYP|nr:pre-mRNA-splicing factor ISY1 [Angomonas deanei]EPY39098.1 pre-mRNA-splicing factor ISY1 [Angomonas deanei]CAD2222180.1 Isy1-like splicing family, putative [Angomonas deanei]|eukprot:EPY27351.1 pre-mRNA-splicing factor ISY1 [Angomonas deanei]
MEDRLKEIEGTLARTAERKNTMLYKYEKAKQAEDRLSELGIKKLPTNPNDTNDVNVVKYVLYQMKRDFGDKRSKLLDPKQISIEKDGEEVVRLRNNELNSLLIKIKTWEKRQNELLGRDAVVAPSKKKQYFGCAKYLPEAAAVVKRERESDESDNISDSEISSSSSEGSVKHELNHASDIYARLINEIFSSSTDEKLSQIEGSQTVTEVDSTPRNPHFILSYVKNNALAIPDEETFKSRLMDERRRVLKEKIELAKKAA